MMDNIGVLVAMVTMVILAFTIVLIKVRVRELFDQNIYRNICRSPCSPLTR